MVALSLSDTHAPPQFVNPALQVKVQLPATHDAVPLAGAEHARPQAPQLLMSDVRLWHPSGQVVNPALQLNEHVPATHVAVPLGCVGHTFPQAPQLVGRSSDTHVPPQFPNPALQVKVQLPATHDAVPLAGVGHSTPQVPQLLTLFSSDTHVPPQLVNPVLQLYEQVPPTHDAVLLARGGHTNPQLPQLLTSVVGFTHDVPQRRVPAGQAHVPLVQVWPAGQQVPPQVVCPLGHCMRLQVDGGHCAVQTPLRQTAPSVHVTPQPPQLSGSIETSRQKPWQSRNPEGHLAGGAAAACLEPRTATPTAPTSPAPSRRNAVRRGASSLTDRARSSNQCDTLLPTRESADVRRCRRRFGAASQEAIAATPG